MQHSGKQSSPYAKKGLGVRLAYLTVALARYSQIRLLGANRRRVVVLCYHAVTEAQAAAFARQMEHIRGKAVALDGAENASDGSVVVTFDDAFAGLLTHAIPAIRQQNIPVAIFAVTGCLGRHPTWLVGTGHADERLPTMTEAQLREVAADPLCTIGSHSVSHRRLGDLPASDVAHELQASRGEIQRLTQIPCDFLALPHGSWRPEVLEMAQRAGYRSVLTLEELASPERWPKGTIGRFTVSPDMWMIEFKLTVVGAYNWLYGWRRTMRKIKGAIRPAETASC